MANLFVLPDPQPEDHQARTDALDTTRSWIVEAPAGSGKTGLLIQRFLKLLTAENVTDPAEVLAITFTRKATVEMRTRVLDQLSAAAENSEPNNTFDRLTRPLAQAALAKSTAHAWNLLDYPARLNIRTIDSISADIARSLPLLAGSSGALTPTEDAAPLYAEAARRTLMHLGGPQAALSAAIRLILLHRDADLAGVQSLIARMLATRDQWGELIPLAPGELDELYLDTVVLPRLEKALDQAICRALTRLTHSLPASFLDRLTHLAAEMSTLDGYKGSDSPIAICAGRYTRPGEKAEHLDHWRALIHLLITPSGKDFRKGFSVNHLGFMIEKAQKSDLTALLAEVRDNDQICAALNAVSALPPAHYPPEQWPITKALFRLLSRALAELQFVFAEHTACDFAELGLLAKSALRRESSVEDLARNTGQTLQHLLCDEMQDTSTSQYELIQLLTERWDGHSQTVFLVGDPKQSIYLFRQARVERFVRTMHLAKLGDLPLGVLHLTANFRSQATLVEHFNADFTQLFPAQPDPAQPEQVPYRPASATRPPASAPARTWHPSPVTYTDSRPALNLLKQAQRSQSAQQIRTLAADALAASQTVAVLVRTRSHLLEVVKALRQSPAVPFRAVDIEPLAERQEILDLLALTRALLHPGDRTAALALLRTPWCGLTLADLHLLAGADDPTLAQTTLTDLIDQRGDLLSADGIARLEPFWLTLQAAHAQRGRLPLALWVERTWRTFHAPAHSTPEELLNISQFFTLLEQLSQGGTSLDLNLFTVRLDRLFAAPAIHPAAVDLMTIHGAKGLEWDVVFVPSLDRTAASNRSHLLSWLEVDGASELADSTVAHGILAPISARGQSTAQLNAWMRSIESAREAAERKRLFYVACTRARQSLHLFASPEFKSNGTLAPAAGSLLQAAWPAAEPVFLAAPPPSLQIPALPAEQSNLLQPDFSPLEISSPGLQSVDLPTLGQLDRIAAAAETSPDPTAATPHSPVRTILRIPLQPPVYTPAPTPPPDRPSRPEGSFASRTFGNTVHAFLSLLAQAPPPADITTWRPRIATALRTAGLPPAEVDRLAQRVLVALSNTLADPIGRWLLYPHPSATTESSLTQRTQTGIQTLRFDRVFRAGPTPGTSGQDLWIIDYKTADPGGRDLPTFLAEQKQTYSAQLTRYAQAHPTEPNVHTALYFPMLPTLIL